MSKSCQGLLTELVKCLRESDCFKQRRRQQPLSSTTKRSVFIAEARRISDEGDAETLEGLASAVRGFSRGGGGRGRGRSYRGGGGGGGRSGRGGRGGRGRGSRGGGRFSSSSSSSTRPPKSAPSSSKGFGSSSSFKSSRGQKDAADSFNAASFLDESELLSQQQNDTAGNSGWSSSDEGDDLSTTVALEELSDAEVAEILGQDTAGLDTLAGVDPTLEANLNGILSEFEFPLDAFQIKSVRHILSGRSVVVCAPTGAGKTAIAEAAAMHFLKEGGRVLYTTPLKALSNQKLGEMRDRFGVNAAGLQTGDASINPEGDVVVMTTEILRNMLYRTEDDTGGPARDRLAGVSLVVFDECHYLGDPSRGSVWEECIINLPENILILAMSATVRNPADLTGWISAVHGDCDLVQTSFRPVPLSWQFCLTPGEGETALLPLLNEKARGINPQLLPPAARIAAAEMQREKEDEEDDEDDGEGWGRVDEYLGSTKKSSGRSSLRTRTLSELLDGLDGDIGENDWHRMPRWQRIPSMEGVITTLHSKKMLPAIWFIFSRKECDASVHRLASNGVALTTNAERAEILKEVELLRADQPEAVKKAAVPALAAGLASHHAGCLPGWKALVERLFQRGIVKAVFATETLAAGINMPARTTLLSALSKRKDNGIASLTHNELLQMAGRAGRRGYDTQGYCVIVQSRWEDPEFAYDIIRKGPEPLRSQFTTNYGMALNLLWSRTMEEAKAFLDRSYARHLSGAGAARVNAEIATLEAKAQKIMQDAAVKAGRALKSDKRITNGSDDSPDDVFSGDMGASGAGFGAWEGDVWLRYQKLQGRRREEKRAARLLRSQLAQERGTRAETSLSQMGWPRAVGLDLSGSNIDDSTYCLPALLVGQVDGGSPMAYGSETAKFVCLGADNMIYFVGLRNIAAISDVYGIKRPENGARRSKSKRSDEEEEVFEMEAAVEAAADATISHAESLRPASSWSDTGNGVSLAEGSALTAAFAFQLPTAQQLTMLTSSDEALEALKQQRGRVADIKAELQSMRNDKRFAKASQRYGRASAKAGVLLDQAAALREELEGRLDGGWREFESVVNVLEAANAFDPVKNRLESPAGGSGDRRKFTPLGLVAREVRGSNELWLASVLTHESLQNLRAPQLAAVLSAVVAPDAVNRSSIQAAYPPTVEVISAVEALEPVHAELSALQIRDGLDVPIGMDFRLSGIVEGWASGLDWAEVTADCGLDDGDIARLLMRTVDTLRQAAYCEHLLKPLRQSARQAVGAMNRKPISDLVA